MVYNELIDTLVILRSTKCAEKAIYLITDCRSGFLEEGLKGIGDKLKRNKITLTVV